MSPEEGQTADIQRAELDELKLYLAQITAERDAFRLRLEALSPEPQPAPREVRQTIERGVSTERYMALNTELERTRDELDLARQIAAARDQIAQEETELLRDQLQRFHQFSERRYEAALSEILDLRSELRDLQAQLSFLTRGRMRSSR